jgi:hypothetical protein
MIYLKKSIYFFKLLLRFREYVIVSILLTFVFFFVLFYVCIFLLFEDIEIQILK